MAGTNFKHGVFSRGVPAEGVDVFSPFGNVFYVDSGGGGGVANDNNSGGDPKAPMATINAAYAKATASQGDVIVVAAGHVETIPDATTLVLDKAGVTIIGLGRGSDRPTLTFSATGSNIPISAVNVSLRNFLITSVGAIDVVKGITLSAADVLLQDIEIREASITSQFVDPISGATCDRLRVYGYKFVGATASDQATQSAINITDTSAEIEIVDYNLLGSFAQGGIEVAAVTDLYIGPGRIEQRHTTRDECIRLSTTATGWIVGPRLRTATDDTAGMDAITGGIDMQLYDIGIVNADGEIAAQHPIGDLERTDNTATTNFPFDFSMV